MESVLTSNVDLTKPKRSGVYLEFCFLSGSVVALVICEQHVPCRNVKRSLLSSALPIMEIIKNHANR